MGTRNLTMVVLDGKFRVAQYGQFDGYPEGAGNDIFDMLQKKDFLDYLKKGLEKTILTKRGMAKNKAATTAGYRRENGETLTIAQQDRIYKHFRSIEMAVRYANTFLSRTPGCDVLEHIAYPEEDFGTIYLVNASPFAGDSLFCEWAYLLDLDRNKLEVYRGFNRRKVTEGRFLSSDRKLNRSELVGEKRKYHPIVKIIEFDMDKLDNSKSYFDAIVTQANRFDKSQPKR